MYKWYHAWLILLSIIPSRTKIFQNILSINPSLVFIFKIPIFTKERIKSVLLIWISYVISEGLLSGGWKSIPRLQGHLSHLGWNAVEDCEYSALVWGSDTLSPSLVGLPFSICRSLMESERCQFLELSPESQEKVQCHFLSSDSKFLKRLSDWPSCAGTPFVSAPLSPQNDLDVHLLFVWI